MIKVRLHGEGAEIEELINRLCNMQSLRVLQVSGHYKDRGASVYERCYVDVELLPKSSEQKLISEQTESSVIKWFFDHCGDDYCKQCIHCEKESCCVYNAKTKDWSGGDKDDDYCIEGLKEYLRQKSRGK